LPPLMHRYRVSYPGIALGLTIGNTEAVAAPYAKVLPISVLSKGRLTTRHSPSLGRRGRTSPGRWPTLPRPRARPSRRRISGHAVGFRERDRPRRLFERPW
jgi:hypothetical protein